MIILKGVRLGRGAKPGAPAPGGAKSRGPARSRLPRANCTIKMFPLNSLPWKPGGSGQLGSRTRRCCSERGLGRTGHDVLSISGIVVLNETEAVHDLDLGDLVLSEIIKEVLNLGLGSCSGIQSVHCSESTWHAVRSWSVEMQRRRV